MKSGLFVSVVALCAVASMAAAQNVEYVASFPTLDARSVIVDSAFAYVVDFDSLLILDVSNPYLPVFMAKPRMPGHAKRLDIDGDYAFMIAGDSGVQIFDISEPWNPVRIGHYQTLWWTEDILADGNYAYVADMNALYILDVSDRANPLLAWSDTLGYEEAVARKNNYLYDIHWAIESDILWTSDVSDPYHPVHVFAVTTAGMFCSQLLAEGNNLFAVYMGRNFDIYDISDPARPLSRSFNSSPAVLRLAADGSLAFVARGLGGLDVLDVSDQANPILQASYDTPASAKDVFFSGGYIYVADSSSLQILHFVPSRIKEDEKENASCELFFCGPSRSSDPCCGGTLLGITLPAAVSARLLVYDILGRQMTVLHDGLVEAGRHCFALNNDGWPSGIYFARLEAGGDTKTLKIMLLR